MSSDGRTVYDDIDLEIVKLLFANSRISYRSIGSAVKLGSKCVKTRIDRLVSSRIIEDFILRVNPACFDYNLICLLIIHHNMLHKDWILEQLNLVDHVVVHAQCIGSISGFVIVMKEEITSKEKLNLLIDILKPSMVQKTILARIFTDYSSIMNDGNARKVISDLVSDRKKIERLVGNPSNIEKWCTCIDGALTKEEYLENIRKVGFQGIEILDEKLYMHQEEGQFEGRKITSITIRATKN